MRSFAVALLPLMSALLNSAHGPARPVGGQVLFLNTPETWRRPGVIYSGRLPGDDTRVFFHFRNGSKRPMVFRIRTDGVKEARLGYGVASAPSSAGLRGLLMLLSSPRNTPYLNVPVPAGMTVSGAMDVSSIDGRLRCEIGEVPAVSMPIGRHSVTPYATLVHRCPAVIRVGATGVGLNKGDYGIVHSFTMGEGVYRVSVSPRGGNLRVLWGVDGKWAASGKMRAKSRHIITRVRVPKNSESVFSVIPVGGYSYPLEVRVEREL